MSWCKARARPYLKCYVRCWSTRVKKESSGWSRGREEWRILNQNTSRKLQPKNDIKRILKLLGKEVCAALNWLLCASVLQYVFLMHMTADCFPHSTPASFSTDGALARVMTFALSCITVCTCGFPWHFKSLPGALKMVLSSRDESG